MNFSIPAYLSEFSTLENGRTQARLKVLYVGETADGRIFDKEMADQIAESLADTPVVAYYSDVKKDFIGHNSTQYVFGHVPTNSEYEYVEDEEEEKTWLVTDVLLYTDRNDNIGTIASKIVGHPHSLELDPKTVDYEFIKEGGKTKIRFKKGKVFGLSVLGTNEKPAFTGSQFFFSQFGDLAEPELREKFELFFSYLEEEGRGEQMNITKEQFDSLLNAAKLSYTEQEELVHKKFNLEIGDSAYAYITRMYNDYAIFYIYDYDTGSTCYQKASFSIDENNEVSFSKVEEVFLVFITKEEKDALDNIAACSSKKDEECDQDDGDKEVEDEDKEPRDNDDDNPENDDDNEDFVEDTNNEGVSNAEDNANTADNETDYAALYQSTLAELETLRSEKVDFEEKQAVLTSEHNNKIEEYESKLAFAEESRKSTQEALNSVEAENVTLKEQLEKYIRQEKERMIADYTEIDTTTFSENIDTYSIEQLRSELAIAYTTQFKNKVTNPSSPLDFNHLANTVESKPLSYSELVEKYKNKRTK